ncbi:MAG TPA: F0F1 ATP synthase subunit B [Gemmatimonadales bacterium]|nr:F0F1 ATP synthase subunit B [Gemmatimonadales bacterium]
MMLSLLPVLQDAEHIGEITLPAPFSPTVGLFIWTWVVFLLLLFVLSKFAYPTIVKMTADREAGIKHKLSEAKRLHAEAEAVLEEQRKLLAGARGEANALLADARQAAERERVTATERTRAEQDEIVTRAKQEIVAERDRAKADLRRETVDLAIAAAGKVIGHELDAAADRAIVEQYLTQIGTKA